MTYPCLSSNSFYSPEEAIGANYDDSKLYPPGEGAVSLIRRLSDSNLQGTFFGASVDSVTDDDDSDRRGSLAGSASGRRGSRLADLLDKKRNPEKKKRKKDKQGIFS